MTRSLLAIFLGGGLGSALRYCIQLLLHEKISPYTFPWSTFTVNILGSLLIGLFYALSEKFGWSQETRLILTTGLCGGFTTFSTFCNDITSMLRDGEPVVVFVYVAASICLGVLAVIAGAYMTKLI